MPASVPPFEFATARRLTFGASRATEVLAELSRWGRAVFLVVGAGGCRWPALEEALVGSGALRCLWRAAGEPTVTQVLDALTQARDAGCDAVIACGGGSVLDLGKAVAALASAGPDPFEYLEVVGRGRLLPGPGWPCAVLPTTAGSGAEVTRNAVLGVPERGLKVSLRGPTVLPTWAIVDPSLCLGLPPAVTASTGLDALTQLLEPWVTPFANPLTDGWAREGIRRSVRSLTRAVTNPHDLAAREDLALASLLGGLCLANARLGAVHGLAAVLGGRYRAPHGEICAALLPEVWQANLRALTTRSPASPARERFMEAAVLLTGDPAAASEAGVPHLVDLRSRLGIRPLREHGMDPADFPGLAMQSLHSSSMQGNPVALTVDELVDVLQRAWSFPGGETPTPAFPATP